MRRIDDHQTESLFDSWGYVGPKRRKLLERGWAGVFRAYLLTELPLAELQQRFHDSMGRPKQRVVRHAGHLGVAAVV